MINSITDTYTLSNGVKIPVLGYGTWKSAPEDTVSGVEYALKAGYRHIDTAYIYGNEESVGEGIRKSGVARGDIFLTTKHWTTHRGFDKTKEAIDISLKNLGVDYFDLYLIHWPCVKKTNPDWAEINAETWRGFEDAYKAGKIRAIGVSNFKKEQLDALFNMCDIKPMVNQIEFHPGYTQIDNVEYSKSLGMLVEAWSPLGCGEVLKDSRIVAMAQKYGKSPAQLCLRFALQNGVVPLCKSVHFERILDNTKLFDFSITEDDIRILKFMNTMGFSGLEPDDAPAN